MFYLAGVGLASFLSVLLLTKANKNRADKILTAWLFVMTIHLLLYYFGKEGLYPQLLGVAIPLPLLHGPFLYLYTRELTNHSFTFQNTFIHFAPFVAELIYMIHFFILPVEKKIYVFKNQGIGYETFSVINLIAIILSGILYVILSSILLHKHRKVIEDEFSSTEKINLQWLQYLIYGIGVIWILVIIGNDDLIFGTTVLFVAFIGFFGIRQVGIFHSEKHLDPALNSLPVYSQIEKQGDEGNDPEKPKYQKSGLTKEVADDLHRRLLKIMKNEKVFQEAELSLADLSGRLATQPNYLSQVINEREGKSFYDFINTLRIEEFKHLAVMPENRKYTILALAEQCGFNSKSSFNRYFKKVTGVSPSDFMKNAQTSIK